MSLRQIETTAKVMIGFAMALSIAPLAIVAVNGQVYDATLAPQLYEDQVAEFFAMDDYELVEFTAFEDLSIRVVVQQNGDEVAMEDAVGEFFANTGYNMTSFIPEFEGKQGQIKIGLYPLPAQTQTEVGTLLNNVGIVNVNGGMVL